MPIVEPEWMPHARMRRIVCHWTTGAYKASSLDRSHYHILIEGDGALVRGDRTIADNESAADGRYAAHTLGANTGSIGVSMCCMADAIEKPFAAGPCPMTRVQWETMAQVVAELCERYGIAVTPRTVLGHGEVQGNLGIAQRGKWDPLVLPWDRSKSTAEVGDAFRSRVAEILQARKVAPIGARPRTTPRTSRSGGRAQDVVLDGAALPGGLSYNESTVVPLSSLIAEAGFRLLAADGRTAAVRDRKGRLRLLPLVFPANEPGADASEDALLTAARKAGCVAVDEIAEALDLPLVVDAAAGRVVIGAGSGGVLGGEPPTVVTLGPGETLYRAALRLLGDGKRWTAFRNVDGTEITEQQAKALPKGFQFVAPSPERAPSRRASPARIVSADPVVAAAPISMRDRARRAVPLILRECAASGVTEPAQVAYILATAQHESHLGLWMTELGGRSYFDKYDGRKDLDNTQPGDGYRYRGRGFVQLTGRVNYRFWSDRLGIDLLGDPGRVADDWDIAATILVQGMRDGTFTGKRLGAYVAGDKRDFFNARAVINGDKNVAMQGGGTRGSHIADIAKVYLAPLQGLDLAGLIDKAA